MTRVRFNEPFPGLSDQARKAFQLACQAAAQLGHPAVGPEHLLVGLFKVAEGRASVLLRQTGYDLVWLRAQVDQLNPPTLGSTGPLYPVPYSPELDGFVAEIVEAAEAAGVAPLTPDYVLAALVWRGGTAARILRGRKPAFWRLRRQLGRPVRA